MVDRIITSTEIAKQSDHLSKDVKAALQKIEAEARERCGLPQRYLEEQKTEDMGKNAANEEKAKTTNKILKKIPTELILGDLNNLDKGYTARGSVLASMPHSKPQSNEFIRRNGNYTLRMVASSDVGLPYGSIPRLLLAWITTEAVRTKSRTITLGKSLAEFLNALGIAREGKRIKALKEQMKRLFLVSISCEYSTDERSRGFNMHIVKKYDFWLTAKDPEQQGLSVSSITLDEEFFNEITRSPVVFYIDALKVLKQSAMAIDLYLWITYKNSYAKHITSIPWESLQEQFGAGYPKTAEGKRDFKRKFMSALKKVAAVYPEASKINASTKELSFVPGLSHVRKTKSKN